MKRIIVLIIIILLTITLFLNLLVWLAANASSHIIPTKTELWFASNTIILIVIISLLIRYRKRISNLNKQG